MKIFNNILNQQINTEKKIENLKHEEQNKEDKAEKEPSIIVIEVDGVKMEGEKNYFEYPESVQKETGILGYDKTIISNENLNNFIKDYCQNVYNFDIEKYGFNGLESFLKINDECGKIMMEKFNSIRSNSSLSDEEKEMAEKDYRQSEEFKNTVHVGEMYSGLSKKILYNMSDGNYPNKTFNHIISRWSNHGKSDLDNFIKNKFFIQKIYDTELIKNMSSEGVKGIFNSGPDWEKGKARITVCEKQTNKIVESCDYVTFDELAKSKYINNLKNGEYFAYSNQNGLNFSVGRFFQNFGLGMGGGLPSVGFNLENNDFLSKYLNKVLVNNITEISPKNKVDIQEILVDIFFMNENIQKILTEKDKNVEFFKYDDNKRELLRVEIENIIKQIEKENNIIIKTYTDITIDTFVSYISGKCDQGEVKMPIYIGHDDIPQLCWGHADYGHFINSSGLNFFKFKHDSSVLEKDV